MCTRAMLRAMIYDVRYDLLRAAIYDRYPSITRRVSRLTPIIRARLKKKKKKTEVERYVTRIITYYLLARANARVSKNKKTKQNEKKKNVRVHRACLNDCNETRYVTRPTKRSVSLRKRLDVTQL